MVRQHRLALVVVALLSSAAACRRQPEAVPTPAPVDTVATCDSACQAERARAQARADSIRNAEAAAAAAAAAAAERQRMMEAARNALTAVVYFDYDASDLTTDTRARLDAKLPVLTANPGIRLRITGYTDIRGSDEYNLALGQRRAAAAKRYLTDRGIDQGRIEIVSMGEERPAAQGEDESAWSQNRRAEFEITAGGDNITVSR